MAYVDPQFLNRMTINTRERYELAVWCELFQCNRKTLLEAVSRVGNNAAKVKSLLKSTAHA